jgi:hypothetical protein
MPSLRMIPTQNAKADHSDCPETPTVQLVPVVVLVFWVNDSPTAGYCIPTRIWDDLNASEPDGARESAALICLGAVEITELALLSRVLSDPLDRSPSCVGHPNEEDSDCVLH